MVYTVFNYNLLEKKFYQSQAFTLVHVSYSYGAKAYSFDSFNLVDQTFLNFNVIHSILRESFNSEKNKTVKIWIKDRRSYWAVIDNLFGFGSVTYFDPTYNLYNVGLVRDPAS